MIHLRLITFNTLRYRIDTNEMHMSYAKWINLMINKIATKTTYISDASKYLAKSSCIPRLSFHKLLHRSES